MMKAASFVFGPTFAFLSALIIVRKKSIFGTCTFKLVQFGPYTIKPEILPPLLMKPDQFKPRCWFCGRFCHGGADTGWIGHVVWVSQQRN